MSWIYPFVGLFLSSAAAGAVDIPVGRNLATKRKDLLQAASVCDAPISLPMQRQRDELVLIGGDLSRSTRF